MSTIGFSVPRLIGQASSPSISPADRNQKGKSHRHMTSSPVRHANTATMAKSTSCAQTIYCTILYLLSICPLIFVLKPYGFPCLSLWIPYLYCHGGVVAFGLYAECRFFNRLSVCTFHAIAIVPVNTARMLLVDIFDVYAQAIFLTLAIHPNAFNIYVIVVNGVAVLVYHVQVKVMYYATFDYRNHAVQYFAL